MKKIDKQRMSPLMIVKNDTIFPYPKKPSCSHSANLENNIEDFPLGRFMRFLKHLKLKRLLTQIKDPRDQKKTEHSIEIILFWVLSVFFFDANLQTHSKLHLRCSLFVGKKSYGIILDSIRTIENSLTVLS